MTRKRLLQTIPAATAALLLSQSDAMGHEAWLLTPSEIEALSRAPMPDLFTNPVALVGAALVGGVGALAALWAEDRYRTTENQIAAPFAALAAGIGPLLIRLGLAAMMILGALGGLPRVGTEAWTQPVLFVPDMQLAMVPGWDWLATAQIVLAGFLAAGLATRAAALGVIALSMLGLVAFGWKFLSYAPHFAAPALILAVFGSGWLGLDRVLPVPGSARIEAAGRVRQIVWYLVMAMVGGTFVYLGIKYKLFQPTLLIAILEHGEFPTFGAPIALLALVMTGVEITAGLLLAMGRLVRPVALFLIGAFTFFAVMLGETPLLHANLYGTAAMLLLAGVTAPRPLAVRTRPVLSAA